jgi:hypothetical protein
MAHSLRALSTGEAPVSPWEGQLEFSASLAQIEEEFPREFWMAQLKEGPASFRIIRTEGMWFLSGIALGVILEAILVAR